MNVRIQVVDSFSRCTTFRVKEEVVSTLLAYQSFPYRIAREGPNRVVGRRWRKGSARWRKDVDVGQRAMRRERVLSMAPVKSEVERIVTEREREANVVSIRQS